MDTATQREYDNLYAPEPDVRYAALNNMLAATETGVDWAYEVWDELVADLQADDNHKRARAAQVLCNLAKSDPEKRMVRDFAALLNVTRDKRFVTARHALQAIWKVGLAGPEQQQILLDGLTTRFHECTAEKNWSLIRYDISRGLKHLYDTVGDEMIRERALALIETEPDEKYRKKYASLWKRRSAK